MLSFLKGKDKPAEGAVSESRSWSQRLRDGLAATREKLGGQLRDLFAGTSRVDEGFYEELESVLLTCDVGVAAARHLMETTRQRARRSGADSPEAVRAALRESLVDLLLPLEQPLVMPSPAPFVILLCGVNGAGKTTSIGKLAHRFQAEGHSVLLAAGDTFRAAAREQLAEWGSRNGVTVVSQASGDPGAVIFDAIGSARARGVHVVLADTAGRLHTQSHLMEELRKIRRVAGRALEGAPHETLLVVDANTGQNAVAQVKAFDDAVGLTGLVLTKLDGTARGGVVAAIARERPVPVRYIGVGEGMDDLRPFEARAFAEAMLG